MAQRLKTRVARTWGSFPCETLILGGISGKSTGKSLENHRTITGKITGKILKASETIRHIKPFGKIGDAVHKPALEYVECGEEVSCNRCDPMGPIMSVDLLEVWGSPWASPRGMCLQNPKEFLQICKANSWNGENSKTSLPCPLLILPWNLTWIYMDGYTWTQQKCIWKSCSCQPKGNVYIFPGGENCPILASSPSVQRRHPRRDGQFKWSRLVVSTCFNPLQPSQWYWNSGTYKIVIQRCYEK